VLPTRDQALDAVTSTDQPLHVARFGPKFDAQGVLAGSRDANRCIGYLTKYLTKHVGRCHQTDTDAQDDHVARLVDALRYEPCSAACANWLRYGITPKNARPGLIPGHCRGKAHRAEHLGYAGRRVLVSPRMQCRQRGSCSTSWMSGFGGATLLPRPDAELQSANPRRGRGASGMSGLRAESASDHLFTVQQAADWLRVSRWMVYNLIHANQLRTIKIGRRRLVTREALLECVSLLLLA